MALERLAGDYQRVKTGIRPGLFELITVNQIRAEPFSSAPATSRRAVCAQSASRSLRKPRRRREFETTKTLESAIAPPAISGLRRPAAASGSAATL